MEKASESPDPIKIGKRIHNFTPLAPECEFDYRDVAYEVVGNPDVLAGHSFLHDHTQRRGKLLYVSARGIYGYVQFAEDLAEWLDITSLYNLQNEKLPKVDPSKRSSLEMTRMKVRQIWHKAITYMTSEASS